MVLHAVPELPLTSGMFKPRPAVSGADPVLVPSEATVWTVGHSNRTWETFLGLLREHRIERVVDVRHFPVSSRVPWANREALAAALAQAGIAYEHLVDLGGYRTPRRDSANTGWRNAGFRGYADYMGTAAFAAARDRLIARSKEGRTAILCAEAVPWRCHRGVLADALLVRGIRVVHILGPGQTRDHALPPFAKVKGGRLAYPAPRSKA